MTLTNIDNIINKETSFEEILEPTNFEDEDYLLEEEERKNIRRLNTNKTLDIISLILAFLILVVLAFLVYSLIFRPLNNGITIEENFWNIFSFLNL